MKTILITGGAGFIGSNLQRRLLELGHKVVVVDNLSTGIITNVDSRSEFYKIDINSPKLELVFKTHRPDTVYMLAYNTNAPKSVLYPLYDLKSLTGTIKSLALSAKYKVKKVIFASTSFVYGNGSVMPSREQSLTLADNPYGISKLAAENYIKFYSKSYGMQYVIFRLATTFGPGQSKGAMADYIRKTKSGERAVIYGDGSKTRDYLFIDDNIDANILALTYEHTSPTEPIFNLSSNLETSLIDLYRKITVIMGKSHLKPIFLDDRNGEINRTLLDNSKIKECMGWQNKTSLDDGLAVTIGCYN
jgi:UDP-glucose 4-epimerase